LLLIALDTVMTDTPMESAMVFIVFFLACICCDDLPE